jgi:hypothetical protein
MDPNPKILDKVGTEIFKVFTYFKQDGKHSGPVHNVAKSEMHHWA